MQLTLTGAVRVHDPNRRIAFDDALERFGDRPATTAGGSRAVRP